MGRLDISFMRHMSKADFRVLVAVEMGMKNHAFVPMQLVQNLAKIRTGGNSAKDFLSLRQSDSLFSICQGGFAKSLSFLLMHRCVARETTPYEGLRLTMKGYDILALRTLLARGKVSALGRKIGVGKESDIYTAQVTFLKTRRNI